MSTQEDVVSGGALPEEEPQPEVAAEAVKNGTTEAGEPEAVVVPEAPVAEEEGGEPEGEAKAEGKEPTAKAGLVAAFEGMPGVAVVDQPFHYHEMLGRPFNRMPYAISVSGEDIEVARLVMADGLLPCRVAIHLNVVGQSSYLAIVPKPDLALASDDGRRGDRKILDDKIDAVARTLRAEGVRFRVLPRTASDDECVIKDGMITVTTASAPGFRSSFTHVTLEFTPHLSLRLQKAKYSCFSLDESGDLVLDDEMMLVPTRDFSPEHKSGLKHAAAYLLRRLTGMTVMSRDPQGTRLTTVVNIRGGAKGCEFALLQALFDFKEGVVKEAAIVWVVPSDRGLARAKEQNICSCQVNGCRGIKAPEEFGDVSRGLDRMWENYDRYSSRFSSGEKREKNGDNLGDEIDRALAENEKKNKRGNKKHPRDDAYANDADADDERSGLSPLQ